LAEQIEQALVTLDKWQGKTASEFVAVVNPQAGWGNRG
jgi:hypothetical protein